MSSGSGSGLKRRRGMPHERSTIEIGLARARDEVRELAAECGLVEESEPEPEPLPLPVRYRPWNRHCPGTVAYAVLGWHVSSPR